MAMTKWALHLFVPLLVFAGAIGQATSGKAPGTRELDLGDYFGPLSSPRALRTDLIREYGEGGCVRTASQVAGVPYDEFHIYYDRSNKRWLEVTVELTTPEYGEVSSVLLTKVSLCENAPSLAAPLRAKGLLGIKIGDSETKLVSSLGPPVRREVGTLGSLTDVSIYNYAPDPESVFIAVFYVYEKKVRAIAATYSE
jgi:hypothetical protein